MRSDGHEAAGKRGSQVVARWVSVKRAAGLLDVEEKTVRRYEAAGFFGAGNSMVLPGGDLRLRARAVNLFAERMVAERELRRQQAAERTRGFLAEVKR